jgi:hypothetical protein
LFQNAGSGAFVEGWEGDRADVELLRRNSIPTKIYRTRIAFGMVSSLDDVCERLDSIEAAIRRNYWDLSWVGLVVFGWIAVVWLGALWNSKIRYSWWYKVNYDQVTIEKEPTDCNFFHAPIGDKGCHYDRQANTIRVKTEYLGFLKGSVNYVSFDDGKTWTVDDANPPTKPQVMVSWEKVEDQ